MYIYGLTLWSNSGFDGSRERTYLLCLCVLTCNVPSLTNNAEHAPPVQHTGVNP